MIVSLSQILGHLFKNSVLKYIHNSKHVFSFLPSNPNIKDITADIQFASDNTNFSLHLKHSKSDTSSAGVNIPIFANDTDICPVTLMRRCYSLRLKSGAKANDPLFLLANGDVLSRYYFIEEMRTVLRLLHYNDVDFNGHSLRRGAACAGHSAKLSISVLQKLGRWSSDAWKVYVDVNESALRNAQLALAAV